MHDVTAIAFTRRKSRAVAFALGAAIAVLTFVVLYLPIFGPQIRDLGDLHDHLLVVQHWSTEWAGNIYSLFFPLTYVLSLGSQDIQTINCVAVVILMASVVAKALLSYDVIQKAVPTASYAAIISFALCLVMPLPDWWNPSELYLDKIAPNIWFNATAILSMPFAIAVFFSALKWREGPTLRNFTWLSLFSLLSVLTKPNYILAFYPLLGLIALTRAVIDRRRPTVRALLLCGLLAAALGAVLLVQYVACAGPGPGQDTPQASGHVAFAPFAVWSLYSRNIPISLLLSVAFPLTLTACYFREARNDQAVVLAWAGLILALLQYVLLAETGESFPDQNWIWGSNCAMYLLFLVAARLFVSQRRSWRFYLVACVFALHAGSGIYYYLKLAFGIDYF